MGFLKYHKRNKWYKCFRPKEHEDFPFEPVPCLKNGGKESNINMLRNNFLMSLSDDDNFSYSDGGGGDHRNFKKSKSRRSLSRAFKAVLFPISLGKKNRSRKSDQEKSFRSSSSSRSLSSKLDQVLNSFRGKKSVSQSPSSVFNKDSLDSSLETDSSSGGSSLLSSSSSVSVRSGSSNSLASSRSPSIASSSRSASRRKRSIGFDLKQLERRPSMICSSRLRSNNIKPIVGLYFLLICLVALVACGKAFAVFCTAAGLFLFPCRFKCVEQPHQLSRQSSTSSSRSVHMNVDSIDIDSEQYKKKVIMEGLLERGRTLAIHI